MDGVVMGAQINGLGPRGMLGYSGEGHGKQGVSVHDISRAEI